MIHTFEASVSRLEAARDKELDGVEGRVRGQFGLALDAPVPPAFAAALAVRIREVSDEVNAKFDEQLATLRDPLSKAIREREATVERAELDLQLAPHLPLDEKGRAEYAATQSLIKGEFRSLADVERLYSRALHIHAAGVVQACEQADLTHLAGDPKHLRDLIAASRAERARPLREKLETARAELAALRDGVHAALAPSRERQASQVREAKRRTGAYAV